MNQINSTKEYQKDDIVVVWQASKCKHAAKCVGGLPDVFKPREQPWIQTEGADKAQIVEVVGRCPSGALSIRQATNNP